ncbi:MAG: formylglycine-generating enzyme family protein [Alphaproteobacteria bacterium]
MRVWIAAAFALSCAHVPLSARALETGEVFQDCPDCPEMVVVGAGSFIMGSDAAPEQRPPVAVTIARPFALATTETTFDLWEACVAGGGCAKIPDDHGWGRGRQPVINISWDEANAFTRWLSKLTGATYRLPTEAEWEYAARAGTTTAYWWGDHVGDGKANCRKCNAEWGGRQSAPVASFPANPFGLYDLNGNVWEWVADCWTPNHKNAPTDGSAAVDPKGECRERTAKGGAWYYYEMQARPSSRARHVAGQWSYTVGFRVLREMK